MSGNPLAAAEPWDLVADGYAEIAPAIMQPFSARALELAGLSKDSRIVDVAAGPGTLSLIAADQVAQVQALDFSAAMVAQLERAAQADGLRNIEARVGDGQALPYGDAQFDAGFSMFGLMFFPERAKGFAELFRVLRPGGVAVVSSWAPIAESQQMQLIFGALRAGDPDIPEPQANVLSLENPEIFHSELRAAGFTGISIQRHTASVAFDSAADLWERMARGSAPLVLMRRTVGEQAWAERAAVMLAYLEQHYKPHRPLSTTAFLGIGHKPD